MSNMDEFELIEWIKKRFSHLLKDETGIGDDCAVIKEKPEMHTVVSTDMLLEGIHFVKSRITPVDLGYKSLAVNLSDIASMGAIPTASFLSLGIPEGIDIKWLEDFLAGYLELSEKYKVPLLGGDTTRSKTGITISVTAMGEVFKEKAKWRKSALVGDLICVTGCLGDSAAGLYAIENDLLDDLAQRLSYRHKHPEPHIDKGRFLSRFSQVHAMMDVSDGIASDLNHILKASGKSAEIDLDKISLSNEFQKFVEEKKLDKYKLALAGGEDYVLVFTMDETYYSKLNKLYYEEFNEDIYVIGKIYEGKDQINYLHGGKPFDFGNKGFRHF